MAVTGRVEGTGKRVTLGPRGRKGHGASTSNGSNPSASGAQKYLAHQKAAAANGPNSFLRGSDFRSAAFSALGFASPLVGSSRGAQCPAGAIPSFPYWRSEGEDDAAARLDQHDSGGGLR